MVSPSPAVCAEIARALERVPAGFVPWSDARVALLSSFTAAPMAPVLTANGAASGVLVRTHVAAGDQWTQEALDASSALRQFDPQVIVIALELEDLSPALVDDYLEQDAAGIEEQIEETADRVRGLLDSLRLWTSAKILMHTFAAPSEPALGMIDRAHPRGQSRAVIRLNRHVREHAAASRDVYLVDVDRLIAKLGETRWRDARMWTLARIPYTPAAMQALAEEYLRYVRAFTGRTRKVLALDLDGTLWGGVVGEDGPDGIHLGVGYRGRAFVQVQRVLRSLLRRGVILTINSKNNPDDALEIITQHPAMLLRRDDFAAVRINWQDKAANLVELAEELELGLDSFVFVDDSAAECERVRQALPEVMTVHLTGDPATYADTLKGLGVFDALSFGEEDRSRTTMYRSEAKRRELRQSMSSLDDFLRSLEMRLDIEPIAAETLARAAELTQRTNQFNLTTRRFTQDELRDFLARPDREGFVFRLRDRFGDHGTIGVALTERDGGAVVISTLLLSCRVLKRTVEDSVVAFLVEAARDAGAEMVVGHFMPSRKNAVAAALYEARGFSRDADDQSGVQRFIRRTSETVAASPWITLQRPERRHV
jgi:FkbH-like protein